MKLTNKAYDTLVFVAQIALPALATLYTGLAEIWSILPYGIEIGATIMLVDTFLGTLLKLSSNSYQKEQKHIEGAGLGGDENEL